MDNTAHSQVKEIALEAVIIRADGSQEELGRIAYWHRNPVKRFVAKLTGLGGIHLTNKE